MNDNQEKYSEQRLQERERVSSEPMMQMNMQMNSSSGVKCPKCGTINEPDAAYCASCGTFLNSGVCPNCGSELDPDSDFCEACHHYIKSDVCSFCGAAFNDMDVYCPECGQPRGGIVCPACHTLNDFSFCKQCGRPLTDQAREIMKQMQELPEYKELTALVNEYDELQMQLPYESEADKNLDEELQDFRKRVLSLLAQDQGLQFEAAPVSRRKRITKEELEENKNRKLEQLADLLSRLAIPEDVSPIKVRNYAMAQKPAGLRVAWKCNYKQAIHSSPCGCAKPQMGGKWIILGHNSKQEIKDDK